VTASGVALFVIVVTLAARYMLARLVTIWGNNKLRNNAPQVSKLRPQLSKFFGFPRFVIIGPHSLFGRWEHERFQSCGTFPGEAAVALFHDGQKFFHRSIYR
jgi:hypothetical protein